LLRLLTKSKTADLPDPDVSVHEGAGEFDMARRPRRRCFIGLGAPGSPHDPDVLGASTNRIRSRKGRIFRVFEMLERMDAGGETDLRASCKNFRRGRVRSGSR
jgi:hypothetical protein